MFVFELKGCSSTLKGNPKITRWPCESMQECKGTADTLQEMIDLNTTEKVVFTFFVSLSNILQVIHFFNQYI